MIAPDITQLLIDAREGDSGAVDLLYEQVYDELRRLAHFQLRRGSSDTLSTTVLVHEAYLKLFDRTRVTVRDRTHFFALSARAMRHILVDHFRRRHAGKRGGRRAPLTLDGDVPVEDRGVTLLAVDEALSRLSELSPRLGRVVECRFFGGMTQPQIAEVLDVSERTIRNDWIKAKAFLARELGA